MKNIAVMAGTSLLAHSETSTQTPVSPSRDTTRLPNVRDVLNKEMLKPRGEFYRTTIPDTLDLAERAKLSIHNLTHNVDPDHAFYNFQGFNFSSKSPGLDYHTLTFDITGKNLRALPWLRTMCGSGDFVEEESAMLEATLGSVRNDGLLYDPYDGFRPKDTSYPNIVGVVALACDNHFEMDGNPSWLDWLQLMALGMKRVAIPVGDRSYYPPECTITPQGKWVWNLRGESKIPYMPPEEPYLDAQGVEGCVKFEQSYVMRALVRACLRKPDSDTLDLLQRLTRFELKLGLWENTTTLGYKGNEHGVFGGHFHGNTGPLLGLFALGDMQKDSNLKKLVREGYNNAICNGVARVGWYPSWIRPTEYERPIECAERAEGCGVAEMVELGVLLSDVGLGDYWDDVDATVRNQLIEQQFTDLALMRRIANGGPATQYLDRYFGGFTTAGLTAAQPQVNGCCSANCAIGMYYAWEGITRFNDGVATVNLFLNRASSWMDVDSYLPYEGKVELHNKQARIALVRIPNWVEIEEVKSFVNSSLAHPSRSQRYLVFENLRKGDKIRLEFPNPEQKAECTINNRHYSLTFRGSTLIDVAPRAKDPQLYPLYQRAAYTSGTAPMRTANRFAANRILSLQ